MTEALVDLAPQNMKKERVSHEGSDRPLIVMQIIDACIESLQCLETLSGDLQTAVRGSYIKYIGDGFSTFGILSWAATDTIISNSFRMREHLRLPRVFVVRRAL